MADLTAAQGTLTNGEPSARALLAHAEEHARAAGRAVEDLPRSLRALRFSPLRRSSRPRLEIVEQRQRLALRLAIQVRRLARDLASFAHRDDLRDQWEEAARRLPPIIGLVAEAASKALAGEGCSQEVAAARELMAEFQREDARPVSAILQATPRAAPRRARRAAGMSAAIPPGEAEELARLRAIAQRLGIPDDVRLLSPWAPLADGGLAGASGAADLLLRFSPVPVLGVTGSAGKTTTSRLAEAMLRASGIETLTSSDAPADNAWPTAAPARARPARLVLPRGASPS